MRRLGLIARADHRGIGYQTREFARHMRPDRILCVQMNDPAWPEDADMDELCDDVRYTSSNLSVDLAERGLDRATCEEFLDGLHIVFAVETVYDFEFINWAHNHGVWVVIQGNPEFYVHHRHPDWPRPDVWAWPTPWLVDALPPGPELPVPASTSPVDAAAPFDDVFRVLHVAGKHAAGDRNGTVEFVEAVRGLTQRTHVTIVTQEDRLPFRVRPGRSNVTVDVITGGVEDRWSMYENQHLLVLPRKYGGLCLPAIEAMASGVAVMMTGCSPNEIWPGPRITARKGRIQLSPFGKIQTYATHPTEIASKLNRLAMQRSAVEKAQREAEQWAAAHSWEILGPELYEPLLR